MALSYPMIRGFRHSWASVEFRFATNLILGIQKVDYSGKMDRAKVRGAGSRIIGHTIGNSDYSGSFTILLEEYNTLLIPSLQQIRPDWQQAFFDIIVSYDGSRDGLTTIVDTLQGCLIDEIKIGTTEAGNADPMLRECTLSITKILWNGVDPQPAQPVAF